MCFAKGVPHDVASLRTQMLNHVNQFCDLLEKKPEETQVGGGSPRRDGGGTQRGHRGIPGRSHSREPSRIPAGVQCLASGSKARSTPQNPETLGLCLSGGPESGREHLGQSPAAVPGISAESEAAVLGCADLAAGDGGGHPRGHLQCGGGRLGIAEWFQLLCGAALRKPLPGLGAPGRSGGAPPHPEGLARSPSWKPSSEETFTLLLTLDPDPSFNCPHRLSCREDTTASGQVFLLPV